MTKSCRWCRVSNDCVLQINVVLIVVGMIFLMDVFSHFYLRTHMFPDIRVYPVVLRSWLFWIRALTMVAYIGNAFLGIRMAKSPSILKFAGYILIGLLVLLYTVSIGVTRFMHRSRFEFFAQMLVYQMWVKKTLELIEAEFECCGMTGVVDYQTASANRTWSTGSCCGKPNCFGCNSKVRDYLWTIEIDVARDNLIVSVFLAIGMIVMLVHYKDLEFCDDLDDLKNPAEPSEAKHPQ
ncbi:hypothetical protein KR018_004513 [Drosophila ironensis]|nr:hypothetical protein KR018_004513 [Drosophila ironensis]